MRTLLSFGHVLASCCSGIIRIEDILASKNQDILASKDRYPPTVLAVIRIEDFLVSKNFQEPHAPLPSWHEFTFGGGQSPSWSVGPGSVHPPFQQYFFCTGTQ